ncbi:MULTISPECIES: hypothetical protein [unclassified Pseudonocardia]|uniref:hypothetical protein n=1 Tax=unclassified Pseudonocardia TaxID=2619320 RepID=UPI00094B0BF7|nr:MULTISPECIES: hypothetical protein [unclassified Pseudonocardia]OLL89405.1 hypothetical protein Ae331Ps2_6304c [Pseudonocardia sp. Ae331_Ps2]OLL89412.1 hypothetical protein Ae331Ps2_6311c [Pseudonocardia sp. Ae331_Ps2]
MNISDMAPAAAAVPSDLKARSAYAALRRIAAQRSIFATAYGRARTPGDRAAAALTAVRAAIPAMTSPRTTRLPAVDRRLDRIADDLVDLFVELHAAQERAAETAIRAKQRTAARSQARREQRRATTTAAGGES